MAPLAAQSSKTIQSLKDEAYVNAPFRPPTDEEWAEMALSLLDHDGPRDEFELIMVQVYAEELFPRLGRIEVKGMAAEYALCEAVFGVVQTCFHNMPRVEPRMRPHLRVVIKETMDTLVTFTRVALGR